MRVAASCLAVALLIALAPRPSQAVLPPLDPPRAEAGAGVEAANGTAVLLARCGPRCKAERRAWRRHNRPHRPPHYRPRPHYHHHAHRGRGDAAAAAILGGVIGLGIGAAIANSRPDYYGYDEAPEFAVPGGER